MPRDMHCPTSFSFPPSFSFSLSYPFSLFLSFFLFSPSIFILFFSLVLFRSLLPCISISSATFLILFFPPPFHPFSPLSFFPPFVLRFFAPSPFIPQLLSLSVSLLLSLSLSFSMGSIRTGSLTVQDGMKRFGMSWSGAGSNSWTNEPTDRTAGACSQIDARGSSWAPLFVYLLHPLYSLLTLLILVHSPLQARKE